MRWAAQGASIGDGVTIDAAARESLRAPTLCETQAHCAARIKRHDMTTAPWLEGITDAIGFVAGALTGFAIGRLFGLDLFAPGYDTPSIIAIVLVGLGGGAGLQLARAWRSSRRQRAGSDRNDEG